MDLDKIIFILRSIGIGGVIRTLSYTIYRDIINKRFLKKSNSLTPETPGNITQITPITSGVCIEFTNAKLDLVFLSQSMIRISWRSDEEATPYSIDKLDWDNQHPTIEIIQNGCCVNCNGTHVHISNSGEIGYHDDHQNILHKEYPPIHTGEKWILSASLDNEEHIYGLGERATSLNLRPGNYQSWNTDIGGRYSTGTDPLYIGTPIYLSLSKSGSYLVYFENSNKSSFSIGEDFIATFEGGTLRYYIIFGSLNNIYKQLTDLIGKPNFPPRWSLGYHQCRWGYRSETDIQRLIDGFEKHNLPISAIHLDIDYMQGYRVFTVNRKRFPNLEHLTNELEKKGIKIVATINPAVKHDQKFNVFLEGRSKDLFCKLPNKKVLKGVSWPGWSVYPDFANPKARLWWSEQYQYLLHAGISGIWHDMNEPSSFSAWGGMTFPSFTQHQLEDRVGDHHEVHNLYGLLMNKAGYEGLLKYAPNKRPWIFSRAGWAGLQKYAWNWTGDVDSSWGSLKQTISTIIGLGISGHAFSGADIGGFSGNPESELYLRWFQMSTFFPLFRTHSAIGTKPREPWVFGEPTTSIIRSFLELRYKLLPYLYSLAWNTAQSGVPPIRPLFWENPEDKNLWDIDDEFLLGESLLVAPVVSKGAKTRWIILPEGLWYLYQNDRQYKGPTQFEIELSMEYIPIFIKGGSIIPFEEDDGISLHVYPFPGHSSFSYIYSDDGDGFGPHRIDNFYVNYEENTLLITWESEGNYPFPYSRINLIIHFLKLLNASADGMMIPTHANMVSTPVFHNLILNFE